MTTIFFVGGLTRFTTWHHVYPRTKSPDGAHKRPTEVVTIDRFHCTVTVANIKQMRCFVCNHWQVLLIRSINQGPYRLSLGCQYKSPPEVRQTLVCLLQQQGICSEKGWITCTTHSLGQWPVSVNVYTVFTILIERNSRLDYTQSRPANSLC